jgi:hypothetical protein
MPISFQEMPVSCHPARWARRDVLYIRVDAFDGEWSLSLWATFLDVRHKTGTRCYEIDIAGTIRDAESCAATVSLPQ